MTFVARLLTVALLLSYGTGWYAGYCAWVFPSFLGLRHSRRGALGKLVLRRRKGLRMDERVNIKRLGFRKWYERELLFSHAQLVLLVLCLVGLLGALELAGDRQGGARLTPLVCALASGAVGVWALRRYLWRLGHAQQVASQAVCGGCQAWARWDVEREVPPQPDEEPRMRVRCRGCAHVWDIAL